MSVADVALAAIAGGAGACVVFALQPRIALPRAAALALGACGGICAAALAAMTVAAQRALPLPPTSSSAGVDLGTLLGSAAAAVLGGIALAALAGLLRTLRRAR